MLVDREASTILVEMTVQQPQHFYSIKPFESEQEGTPLFIDLTALPVLIEMFRCNLFIFFHWLAVSSPCSQLHEWRYLKNTFLL